jgi:hypothetical protein
VKFGNLPEKALEFLNRLEEASVDWVLVGAAAVNLYRREPRATLDIDVVVRKKHIGKVRRILKAICTDVRDTEVHLHGTLSPEPMRLDVDVIKSQSHALFEEALGRKVLVEGVKVPILEALLSLKYLSAVSPFRSREDRGQDVIDFMKSYKENRERIDRKLLVDLASRAHERAPKEFPEFLDAVENDRPITV